MSETQSYTRPEVSEPSRECPHPEWWSCQDGQAVETEVRDFLFALVRLLKPGFIVETGTYTGYSTRALIDAAAANGLPCTIYTCDVETKFESSGPWHSPEGVTLMPMNLRGEDMIRELFVPVDFAFLDSSLQDRALEYLLLLPKLSRQGVVVVHDTSELHGQHGGPREWVRAAGGCLLPTPRGVAILRPTP